MAGINANVSVGITVPKFAQLKIHLHYYNYNYYAYIIKLLSYSVHIQRKRDSKVSLKGRDV